VPGRTDVRRGAPGQPAGLRVPRSQGEGQRQQPPWKRRRSAIRQLGGVARGHPVQPMRERRERARWARPRASEGREPSSLNAKVAVQEAAAAINGKRVPRNVNTGNPLITRKNARGYLEKAEKKPGGP